MRLGFITSPAPSMNEIYVFKLYVNNNIYYVASITEYKKASPYFRNQHAETGG